MTTVGIIDQERYAARIRAAWEKYISEVDAIAADVRAELLPLLDEVDATLISGNGTCLITRHDGRSLDYNDLCWRNGYRRAGLAHPNFAVLAMEIDGMPSNDIGSLMDDYSGKANDGDKTT